ncbi:MAG: cation:proton antiporter [Muribaculaceae bacterium]|nr:cation:proton antiporter [Muribaculaceae bacterium]
MIFLSTTPLVTNPVLIFFIVLAIILLAPVILNRFKIPHIIGLIVAGIVVGPYGFHVLAYDMSFELFGKVGLLYLMFLAGIEIDMYHLKLNFKRGLVFGVLTFMLPMIIGTLASVYLLGMEWVTSLLLASMYASHTLISYPVVARFGISKNPAVLIAIVGTIIAVIGALLVLAAAVNVHNTGEFNVNDLLWLLGRLVIYCTVMMVVYPRVTRWFFKNFSDKVTQFVYIMALVFLASWFAQAIGLEAVLGAFFAGLVLNRFIPNASPLMSRIEFVGNAIFIPYFLIGVGMMINTRVIANVDTIVVALNMITVAIVAKWLAAWFAQKIYRMGGDERKVLFGLTTAHTAVALAVVTIGYNLHLMDETVLNGTVLMILVTCAIAPIVTSGAATRIKIKMLEEGESKADVSRRQLDTNTLIPVATPMAAQPLVELALLMRSVSGRQNIYALHVRNDNSSKSRALGRSSLEQAQKAAASVDATITPIERYDMSTPIGILNTIEERDITDVILGMHRKSLVIDSFFGPKIEHLLKTTNKMLIISRCYVPLNTITRIVVSVPPKAQYETGFRRWVVKVGNLAREIGCRVIFCCHPETRPLIRGVLHSERLEIRNEYRDVEQWDDFVLLANRILDDDLLVVVSARRTSVSFSADMDSIPGFVQRYFSHNNLIVLYPEQFGEEDKLTTFVDPLSTDMNLAPLSIWMRMSEWYRSVVTNRRNKKNIDL